MFGSHNQSLTDSIRFFYTFVRSPRQVGSIMPSSRFLARKMLKEIPWEQLESIVELGAGTGVFTKRIAKARQPDCVAVIFEQDHHFREQLTRSYPELIYRSNAKDLLQTVKELKLPHVDAIISGLPFATLPKELTEEVLYGVVKALKPGGLFVTFQYSLHMKKQLDRQFSSVSLSYVPLNIPPAFVYTCVK